MTAADARPAGSPEGNMGDVPAAWAVGLAALGHSGAVLDTAYPVVNLGEPADLARAAARAVGHAGGSRTYPLDGTLLGALAEALAGAEQAAVGADEARANLAALRAAAPAGAAASPPEGAAGPGAVRRAPVLTFIGDLAAPPVDTHDVYLRLHLLSHRLVRPRGLNLDGVFALLPNVVWTNLGPFEPGGFELARLRLRAAGVEVQVHSLDKFPRLLDYVVPSGVRVADANRVRLGAYLAPGTTVMHEGFVNFNAGTLGSSMVEGRVSAGVVVGDGSDVGGGASIMGTLSGGGKEVIRVGEGCLIGANAGIGISLGDRCVVEAGLYVTAGARVRLPDGRVVKARDLSGQDDLLFRRDSQSGAVEVLPRRNQVVLNAALHAND